MKTKFIINKIVILFFLIALLLNTNNVISSSTIDTTTKTGTYLFNSLVEHGPIQITSESDPDLAEFSGTGAIGDPYIIEGYLIETTDTNGIFIESVAISFAIRNCYIDAGEYGIYINDVYDAANAEIEISNTTCMNNQESGIHVLESYGITLFNNTLNNNGYGVYSYHCWEMSCDNSTAMNNPKGGLHFQAGFGRTVMNNTCINNADGGISIQTFRNVEIANNILLGNGFYFSANILSTLNGYTVHDNNFVNDKKFGFYNGLVDEKFTNNSYGQLLLYDCTDIILENQVYRNATCGLIIAFCTNVTVKDCDFSYDQKEDTRYNCFAAKIKYSDDISIYRSNFSYTDVGIEIWDVVNMIVKESRIIYNDKTGIMIFGESSNITIDESIIAHNGLHIYGDAEGIAFYSDRAHNCTFSNSLFVRNVKSAIRTNAGENITVYGNTFISNDYYFGYFGQCADDGTNNIWYNPETNSGNYWEDWIGTGTYAVEGSAGSVDLYPLELTGDDDSDGLYNIEEELLYGTYLDDPDSDDDGYTDLEEVLAFTDPLDSNDPGVIINEFSRNCSILLLVSLLISSTIFILRKRRK